MTVLAILLGCAAAALLGWALCCRRELRRLTAQLERLEPGSNAELTSSLRTPGFLGLCRAVNTKLRQAREGKARTERAERELKYAIASVSHDIRTPLTGAGGYLQLLQTTEDAAQRANYLDIVRRRLGDLESMLDELFLYTQLTGGEQPLACGPVQAYPALCEALAGFYRQFSDQDRQPKLDFEQMEQTVEANPEALRRVFRNLVSNALRHGLGDVEISQRGKTILFANRVPDPAALQPARLFDRFYRADTARGEAHAGLGLSIVGQLMEKMGGAARACLQGDRLEIELEFA